jgi:hypothetical protein
VAHNERANAAAVQLAALNEKVVAVVKGCPDGKWQEVAPADGRQINVVASHIANGYGFALNVAHLIVDGKPLPPITNEMLDAQAAEHAAACAGISKGEVVAQLQDSSSKLCTYLETLTDADLDKASLNEMLGRTWTPLTFGVEGTVWHTTSHLESITKHIG